MDALLTPAQDFKRWNQQHIALSQALLGVISPNMRMVWLDHQHNSWILHFVLEHDSRTDVEEISDALTQFEALQGGAISCRADVVVRSGPLDWPDPPARVVYRRREA